LNGSNRAVFPQIEARDVLQATVLPNEMRAIDANHKFKASDAQGHRWPAKPRPAATAKPPAKAANRLLFDIVSFNCRCAEVAGSFTGLWLGF
jgi:hypothetical protein